MRQPHFTPPTSKPETDFQLRIKVLTFNRPSSLQRLLDSLYEASYEDDQNIELEIFIDYPSNMTDTKTIEAWQSAQSIAHSFNWEHGPSRVTQHKEHRGLVGQWTTTWQPKDNDQEICLFLEDDTIVSKEFYIWIKRMTINYYLNPANYDPHMYGFALQLQHTILGETLKERYGSRKVHELLFNSSHLYRYQLIGTWGGVFFPQHWREFLNWIQVKQLQYEGVSFSGFQPCVPTLLSNRWWQPKPHKVWEQWFIRFIYEKGWYNVYTNFPGTISLVGNYREAGENFKETKGLMNSVIDHLTENLLMTPPLSSLPLYDFHFKRIRDPSLLSVRNSIMYGTPNCWTMQDLKASKM